jgi:hypothetical protein
MRIHDINVKADLNAEDPNAPEQGESVEYDGTTDGSTSDSEKNSVDSTLDDASDFITSYWTGPWLVLHIMVDWAVIVNVEFSLHITVDLLLSINVGNDGCISIYEPVMNHHGYYGQAAVDKARDSTISAMNILSPTEDPWDDVEMAWVIATAAGLFAGIHPATTGIYLAALSAWVVTIVNALAIMYERVKNGVLKILEAFSLIVTKGLIIFMAGIVELATGVMGNMIGMDSDAASYSIEAIKDRNPAADWFVEGFVMSGVIQIIAGFGIIMFGAMLGLGIIPV